MYNPPLAIKAATGVSVSGGGVAGMVTHSVEVFVWAVVFALALYMVYNLVRSFSEQTGRLAWESVPHGHRDERYRVTWNGKPVRFPRFRRPVRKSLGTPEEARGENEGVGVVE